MSTPDVEKTEHTAARLQVLLEEYRALNALLLFRLSAIDRRLPMAGGLLTGSLAVVPALPSPARLVVLWAVPAAAVWLVSNAIANARSKADHLNRIAELEERVNRLVGCSLMRFQSQHPSRGRVVAGRSGWSTVVGVSAAATAWLVGALHVADEVGGFGLDTRRAYACYVVLASIVLVENVFHFKRYRSVAASWLDH